MSRLARRHRKKTKTKPTILGTLPIDLAPKERARLFGGLQALVNAGNSQDDYQALSKQWPTFWPDGSQLSTAWLPEEHSVFLDYRDKLRRLWSEPLGEQQIGIVAYLLGLISAEDVKSLFFTGPDALVELWFQRASKPALSSGAVSTSHSIVLPVWGSIDVRFFARGDFEAALWALFRESWRARVCEQCRRWFIAEKAAQKYCSTKCNGEAKRGQRLSWWNKTGAIKRKSAQARSKKPKVRRSR